MRKTVSLITVTFVFFVTLRPLPMDSRRRNSPAIIPTNRPDPVGSAPGGALTSLPVS
jgi:hypothetical protein